MRYIKKKTQRKIYKTQLKFSSEDSFKKYVHFEKLLIVTGESFEEFLLRQIDLYFWGNKNLIKGKNPLLNRLVNNKQLVNEVEKSFGLLPVKQEIEYYRKNKWRIGRHYFKRKVNQRAQYLYDLRRVLRTFSKIISERKEREKKALLRAEKRGQVNGYTNWFLGEWR